MTIERWRNSETGEPYEVAYALPDSPETAQDAPSGPPPLEVVPEAIPEPVIDLNRTRRLRARASVLRAFLLLSAEPDAAKEASDDIPA